MPRSASTSLAVLGVAAILLSCSNPDRAAQSPFFLWGMRPGMQLDSVEQFLIRQDNIPWAKCEGERSSVRRCERGRWKALMTFDGRMCTGTTRPCPALVQLLDWRAAQGYADMSVPTWSPP